jgi:putative transcriptional regulator
MLSSPGVTPIQSRTLVQLYRAFLRLGRRFDEEPSAKALIYRTTILPRLNRENHITHSLPSHPFTTTKVDPKNITQYFNEVLDEILEERFLYLPPSSDKTKSTSASGSSTNHTSADIVNTNNSGSTSMHSTDNLSTKRFQSIIHHEFQRCDKDYLSTDERIDTAFALLRKFTMIWNRHKSIEEDDDLFILDQNPNEHSQESQSQSSEGHNTLEGHGNSDSEESAVEDDQVVTMKQQITVQSVKELTPGIILAAHPMLTGPLHRTVILLLEHSETSSYGIVLNRPTTHTLSTAVKNLPQEFVSQFGPCQISFGGMVRRMQWIHPFENCGGVLIPNCATQSLYAGGTIHRALSFVRKNPEKVENFKFFVGCCCWGPGQLEEEMNAGYWISGISQPDRLLELAHYNSSKKVSAVVEQETGESSSRRFAHGREVVGNVDIYQVMLDALGYDYQKLGAIPSWLDSTMVESCDWQA